MAHNWIDAPVLQTSREPWLLLQSHKGSRCLNRQRPELNTSTYGVNSDEAPSLPPNPIPHILRLPSMQTVHHLLRHSLP